MKVARIETVLGGAINGLWRDITFLVEQTSFVSFLVGIVKCSGWILKAVDQAV